MKRIDRNFAVLAAAFCMTLGAVANVLAAPAAAPVAQAAPPAADDPAKVAAAREFITLAHPRTDPQNVAASIDKAMPRLIAGAKRRDPKLDAKVYESQTRARMISTAANRLDLEAQIVSRHFTTEELKELAKFYDSPLGRKLTGETPKIQMELLHMKRQSDGAGSGAAVVIKAPAPPQAPPHK
jgi:hypothetical protein